MTELKGTKTEQNLMTAFAGESQAHTKYQYYASQAKKDGYVQIARIFEETAANEKEHAKIWFKLLHDGAVPKTEQNLKDAAEDRTLSGQACTLILPKPPVKRAWTKLPACLTALPRWKKNTSCVIANCWLILSKAWCLPVRVKPFGFA